MDTKTILDRARQGLRLDAEESLQLYAEAATDELTGTAHELRLERASPGRVTYLVDRNVNYTNVCITDCTFCAFYRPPGHAEAYVLSREAIAAKLADLVVLGGTRVLLQGGHNPSLPLAWYEDLLVWMRAAFPSLAVDGFSPSEVAHIAAVEQSTVARVLERLARAGLAGLPGGGGENLMPAVRYRATPLKQTGFGWLETMRLAQNLGLATTATQVIGFGETLAERLGHLLRLRQLQDDALAAHGNGFIAYISWTMQLEHNAMGKVLRKHDAPGSWPATTEEYLRHVAMARLVLDNFPHHQASWPTMGPQVAARALKGGADDYGSTMLEENVVSKAGASGTALAEESIRESIRAAGFIPAKRDTRYTNPRRVGLNLPGSALSPPGSGVVEPIRVVGRG